jgi:putative PIN family toxin of toxin-antitoxin system
MKVVFDTNVLLSSTLWNNSSAQKLLINIIQKNIKNYASIDILNEYKEINIAIK